jgi:hypothetical protein
MRPCRCSFVHSRALLYMIDDDMDMYDVMSWRCMASASPTARGGGSLERQLPRWRPHVAMLGAPSALRAVSWHLGGVLPRSVQK